MLHSKVLRNQEGFESNISGHHKQEPALTCFWGISFYCPLVLSRSTYILPCLLFESHHLATLFIPYKRLPSLIYCTIYLSTFSADSPPHSQAVRTQMRPLPWLLPLLEVRLCGVYCSSEVKVSPEASQANTSCRRASSASILALRSRSHWPWNREGEVSFVS